MIGFKAWVKEMLQNLNNSQTIAYTKAVIIGMENRPVNCMYCYLFLFFFGLISENVLKICNTIFQFTKIKQHPYVLLHI